MKWAILIAAMLGLGLAFMLRDVSVLQGLGELEFKSAPSSPGARAPAETEGEPFPAGPPAIKNVYYQYVSARRKSPAIPAIYRASTEHYDESTVVPVGCSRR